MGDKPRASCVDVFFLALEDIHTQIRRLRGLHPDVALVVAMQLPKLSLLAETRVFPISYGTLRDPSLAKLLTILEGLPAGSVIALYPGPQS